VARILLILLAAMVSLAGCTPSVEFVRESTQAPIPAASYLEAAQRGADVYEIIAEQSLMLVRVGRSGRAQRLGHDHAIASEDLAGYVETGRYPAESRADIAFPLRNLIVDKPEYREHFELDTEPSADDIAGTYANMLKILEPDSYTWATINAHVVAERGEEIQLGVSVSLHGATMDYVVPVQLRVEDSLLVADARAVIDQSDFGIEPFSAAGGLLRVADELVVELHIAARRLKPREAAVRMRDATPRISALDSVPDSEVCHRSCGILRGFVRTESVSIPKPG